MTPRLKCQGYHMSPQYVVVEESVCDDCHEVDRTVGIYPWARRAFDMPAEVCSGCLRDVLWHCSNCDSTAIRWVQAVPA